jgi:hypothetical protein
MMESGRAAHTPAALLRLTTRAQALVAPLDALAFALARPALEPAIPPHAAPAIDPDLLRTLGALYLAACFEAAGVIPAAEDLARLARTGAIQRDLGEAAGLVQAFWSGRNERATEAERRAFYADVFGTPADAALSGRAINAEFEELLLDLCEALYRVAQAPPGRLAETTAVRRAAERLIENLDQNTSGMTVVMTKDILESQRVALTLLNHPALQAALGAHDVWQAIARIDSLMRRPERNARPHIDRGRAGLTLLVWLADVARARAEGTVASLEVGEAVVEAALDWLEASLALGEAAEQQAPPATAPGASWAALAR